MGQKVNPNIFRIGITRSWDSKWFSEGKKFTKLLHQDIKIREFLKKKLKEAAVSRIEILRSANQLVINIHSAKPGTIIGLQGESVEVLKKDLEKLCGDRVEINIKEVKKPALSAQLLAESIAQQVEKRVSYRRAAKMGIDKALEAGALGAKILASGRLNGVEISRSEFFTKGKVPLHTLRADIDFACIPAATAYGSIGIKVWIYKGLVFKKNASSQAGAV